MGIKRMDSGDCHDPAKQPEYGSVKAGESKRRTLGLKDLGLDVPVLLLCWLFFVITLLTFSLSSEVLVSILGLAFGVCVSSLFLMLSHGNRWAAFSGLCFASSFLGAGLGLHMRPVDRNHTVGSGHVWLCCSVALVYLLCLLVLGALLSWFDCALVGSSATIENASATSWRPRVAANMIHGFDLKGGEGSELAFARVHPRWVSAALLNHQCFWSGEVAPDCMFSMANDNMFLACILSHPANGFHKLEHWLMLLICCALVVFPVTLANVVIGGHLAQVIFIFLVITVPRNALKLYLKKLVLVEEEILLGLDDHHCDDHGNECRTERAANAGRTVCWFFGGCLTFTITIAFFSCMVVRALGWPLGPALVHGCTGLVYAFVLELVLYFVLPQRCNGEWVLGFVHRWLKERCILEENMKAGCSAPLI